MRTTGSEVASRPGAGAVGAVVDGRCACSEAGEGNGKKPAFVVQPGVSLTDSQADTARVRVLAVASRGFVGDRRLPAKGQAAKAVAASELS